MCKILTWFNVHCAWLIPCGVRCLRGRSSTRIVELSLLGEQLWQVCQELRIAQSVGRTGECFDHAMSESFWSTLKTEFYDRKKWATRDEARKAVARCIEIVYNWRRRHSSIGMINPVDFEARIADQDDKRKPLLNYVSTIYGQPHYYFI